MFQLIKKILPPKVTQKILPAYHFCLNFLAALIYGFPSNKMIVVGITGTTGKTSTVYILMRLLNDSGIKTGCTSTALFNDGAREWTNDKKMTMMGRFFTQKILAQMFKNGCKVAIVESTSQGVLQYRHRFINYDYMLFTNLYPEHIEAHGGFENYKNAKAQLFIHLNQCARKYLNDDKTVNTTKKGLGKMDLEKLPKTSIVNANDENSAFFLDFPADEKIAFYANAPVVALSPKIMPIKAYEIKNINSASSFKINNKKYILNLPGFFNVSNALAALSVCFAMKIDPEVLKTALNKIQSIPGRMEKINDRQNFEIIVDYAFEPNALQSLYASIDRRSYNRVIHVLGSTGGGRDKARRPVLGKIAGENADLVIITNEDPYDDDPLEIINEVAAGALNADKELKKDLFTIEDRRLAIRKALSLAQAGDLVLITGKGSEQAIAIAGGQLLPWDDRQVVREELKKVIS